MRVHFILCCFPALLISSCGDRGFSPIEYSSFETATAASTSDQRRGLEALQIDTQLLGRVLPSGKTTLTEAGEPLVFHAEVAHLLEEFVENRSGDPHYTPDPEKHPECLAQQKLMGAVESSSQKCSLSSDLINRLQASQQACENLYQPFGILESYPEKPVASNETNSLKKQILISAAPMLKTQLPALFRNSEYRRVSKQILIKVFGEEIKDQLEGRSLQLAELQAFLSSGSCGEETASLKKVTQDALDEVHLANRRLADFTHESAELAQQERAKKNDPQLVYDRDRPFELLLDRERELLSMFLGVAMWRMRGAGFYEKVEGAQWLRTEFLRKGFNSLGRLSGGRRADWAGYMLWTRTFLGWGEWFDMGRRGGTGDKYEDLASMRDRGTFQIEALLQYLDVRGYSVTPFSDFDEQFGNCYFYAWERIGGTSWGEDLSSPYHFIVQTPISLGELCVGAILGLEISRSLNAGYKAQKQSLSERDLILADAYNTLRSIAETIKQQEMFKDLLDDSGDSLDSLQQEVEKIWNLIF